MGHTAPAPLSWEEWELAIPRGTSRNATTRLLTELAERQHWELVRSRVFPGGDRSVLLRRKIYRLSRTRP